MTMQEINKKLEELCKQEFYLQMKDRGRLRNRPEDE